jgi:hypothetical protein
MITLFASGPEILALLSGNHLLLSSIINANQEKAMVGNPSSSFFFYYTAKSEGYALDIRGLRGQFTVLLG